ncbi:hypothetical protein J437_LFUL006008 [Ladona fulva]|uniref:PDZ domain-containing protein n=1 Tax=Ladona fulva TaxID=123851 RepID=A0A8K0JZW3_LADFU|nr:hypothetical protein J437_LFUL006008 [Ladona fulva]
MLDLQYQVAGGSLAEKAGLQAGDALVRVNAVEVFNLRHKEAQDTIVRAGNNFELTVQRRRNERRDVGIKVIPEERKLCYWPSCGLQTEQDSDSSRYQSNNASLDMEYLLFADYLILMRADHLGGAADAMHRGPAIGGAPI